MARKAPRFSDQVRQAIETCGKTRYRLAKETGVDESLLSRFVRGKCNLSLNQIDKLADNIGFGVKMPKKGT